jgi:sec-independent protein translocase protein TatA
MPNLGPAELLVIMAIALIVFGPKKLPEIGKGLGNALREFNKARNDFMDSLNTEAESTHEPTPSPSYHSAPSLSEPEGTVAAGTKVEYPEPHPAEPEDALPYGSDFHAVEGDSQPSFRTAEPDRTAEPGTPVASAAHGTVDYAGSVAHSQTATDGKA